DLRTTLNNVFLTAISNAARPYKDDLIRMPRRYKDLASHPYKKEFKEAYRVELRRILAMGVWRLLNSGRVEKPLPLKWVFTYKFDEGGHLIKCKARIYVRRDLQETCDESTYAATLAAKSFRTLY